MPPYLDVHLWNVIWPVPAMALLVAALLSVVSRSKTEGRTWLAAFISLASVSTLGAVAGTLAGFSRSPVLSSVLPILLLIGGMTIYLISRENPDTNIRHLSVSVFALALTVWIGVLWGSALRADFNEYQRSEEHLKREADRERAVRTYRERLGLPPDFTVHEYR